MGKRNALNSALGFCYVPKTCHCRLRIKFLWEILIDADSFTVLMLNKRWNTFFFFFFSLGHLVFLGVGAFCQTLSTAFITGLITGQPWNIQEFHYFLGAGNVCGSSDFWVYITAGINGNSKASIRSRTIFTQITQQHHSFSAEVLFEPKFNNCLQPADRRGVKMKIFPFWVLSQWQKMPQSGACHFLGHLEQSFNIRSCLSPTAALWSGDFGIFGILWLPWDALVCGSCRFSPAPNSSWSEWKLLGNTAYSDFGSVLINLNLCLIEITKHSIVSKSRDSHQNNADKPDCRKYPGTSHARNSSFWCIFII